MLIQSFERFHPEFQLSDIQQELIPKDAIKQIGTQYTFVLSQILHAKKLLTKTNIYIYKRNKKKKKEQKKKERKVKKTEAKVCLFSVSASIIKTSLAPFSAICFILIYFTCIIFCSFLSLCF